ncbi:MAG: nuclear transport factor 2 family protein [Pseudomonadota bacterium]
MDENSRQLIQNACIELSTKFAFHVDHGDAEAVAALFAQDGVFSREGALLEGAEGVLNALKRRPPTRVTRHVCTNILVDVVDENTATGNTYFLLYEGEDPDQSGAALPLTTPVTVGEYQDQFVRTEQGWKIARRDALGVFRRMEG